MEYFQLCGQTMVLHLQSRIQEFAKHLGFVHGRYPYLPRANGEVKRLMRTVKVITTAVMKN